MTRWTKSACLSGKHEQPLFPAVRTPDAGKPTTRIAAVEITLHHLLDDRAEEAVLLLETRLIFLKELVKVMEEHPVEHGALRMTGPINSCHNRNIDSGNRPEDASEVVSPRNNGP
ncbi:MAG: hypothetical protein U9O50_03170 [Acidobacteriota bacterium]|nr:hypothetical protein [Acidobacteriota bacterium]